jgi:hypothetical protein
MIKKYAIITGLLLSTNAMAQTTYKAWACYDKAEEVCELVEIDEDFISDFYLERSTKGNGLGHLVDYVIKFTSLSLDGVSGAVGALRNECLERGYTKFTAEFSGPAGTATFTYHMESKAWDISHKPSSEDTEPGTGGGGRGGKPKKTINK